MGKKRNKKKKNKFNKAHIFQAAQSINKDNSTSTAAATVTTYQASATTATSVLSGQTDSSRQEDQFSHVVPDLKFFSLVSVLMIVILAVIYFWDASAGIILSAGQWIYDLLHLN